MKVLVCGDVRGRFEAIISRVNTIIKKTGTYDALFCVGEFFGEVKETNQRLLEGQFVFPISTYVLGPCSDETLEYYENIDGCQLCKNVLYLGKKGFFNCATSLRVAYLSGKESSNKEKSTYNFDVQEISSLTSNLLDDFKGVDLLLTSQWPKGVTKFGTNFAEEDQVDGSYLVSQLALRLKPRYHFSGSDDISYERQPYRNHAILNVAEHVTRFVALSSVGNLEKKKFIYAFNINPMSSIDNSELVKQSADTSECPYKVDQNMFSDKKTNAQNENKPQFFYDQKVIEKGIVENARKRKGDNNDDGMSKRPKLPPITPDSCWFCLANPKVEKHLVVSVGEHCYLALAKGGLSNDHVMIIPINHTQSLASADEDVLNDINLYKDSLIKYFRSVGKCVVFFERNFKTSHLQIQAIPLPLPCEKYLEKVILDYAVSQQTQLKELPQMADLRQINPNSYPYFYVETPQTRFFTNVKGNFSLNFGREMLCQPKLLNALDKVDWKACQMTKEQEDACCAKIRNNFKTFDPFA